MILREFRKEDAAVICGWIRTEEELYDWSADQYNRFPLRAEDILEKYAPLVKSGRFLPFSAEEEGRLAGHFILRYPDPQDDSSVRIGYVIVDPQLRGRHLGKKMLELAIGYARSELGVRRIDLGVFEKNTAALRCYESAGFREYSRESFETPLGVWEALDMELFTD